MKKNYHICVSGGDEIIFRDVEDYNRGFNFFALALCKTNTVGLVEAFMSTHCHLLVQTEDPNGFVHTFRNSYSKYYNYKYQRSGRLGESHHFSLDIVGYHHLVAAASYVLRNPLHHGVVSIPYAYPHSSINSIFRREMGKFLDEPIISSKAPLRKLFGRFTEYPSTYKFTSSGLLLRESVLDIPQMENLFVTPRSFNYYMTRKSSEEWEAEQQKDNISSIPINIKEVERNVNLNTYDEMLYFEAGKADYRKMTDIELCTEINKLVQDRYHKQSVYQLDPQEQKQMADYLYKTYRLNSSQIKRCLVMLD
jgi:hypothetical protein